MRLDGSAPVTITDAGGANGADWTVGDEIVLGAQGGFHGLSHVSAAGGEPVALTQPDTAKGERDHLWPIALPDGKTIVFTIWSGSLAASRLAITSLDDGDVVPLGIPGIRPLAVLDGMLVYVQADGAVMAVALDARRKRVEGRPIPVHDPVPVVSAINGNSGIFISRGGALVTSRGGARGRLAWVSRDGQREPVLPQARGFTFRRLSPDERRIAVVVSEGQKSDVWIYDLDPVDLFAADVRRDGDLRRVERRRVAHRVHGGGRRGAQRGVVAARLRRIPGREALRAAPS